MHLGHHKTKIIMGIPPKTDLACFHNARPPVIRFFLLMFFVAYPCKHPIIVYSLYESNAHDDVIKWKHFPRYWPFVRGIHRSPVNSPHKGQWCGASMFPLICAWINGWVKNRKAGDLRRNRAHYDVTVMRNGEENYSWPWKYVSFRNLNWCRMSSLFERAIPLIHNCMKLHWLEIAQLLNVTTPFLSSHQIATCHPLSRLLSTYFFHCVVPINLAKWTLHSFIWARP